MKFWHFLVVPFGVLCFALYLFTLEKDEPVTNQTAKAVYDKLASRVYARGLFERCQLQFSDTITLNISKYVDDVPLTNEVLVFVYQSAHEKASSETVQKAVNEAFVSVLNVEIGEGYCNDFTLTGVFEHAYE